MTLNHAQKRTAIALLAVLIGLPVVLGIVEAWAIIGGGDATITNIVGMAFRAEPWAVVGTLMVYSSVTMLVLGHVLERAKWKYRGRRH